MVRTPFAPPSLPVRTRFAPPSPARSAVTNRTRLFAIDGNERSPWTRRFKDLIELHIADLGGWDAISEAQASLCRRVATIEVTLEQAEANMSNGADVGMDAFDAYVRWSGGLRRLLETLGIERRAKPIEESVDAILERKAREWERQQAEKAERQRQQEKAE
jgi:hypothetical protein